MQARGKNQLIKELNECADLNAGRSFGVSAQKKIIFIKDALHRNEETFEVEPNGIVEEVFEENYPNKKHMA